MRHYFNTATNEILTEAEARIQWRNDYGDDPTNAVNFDDVYKEVKDPEPEPMTEEQQAQFAIDLFDLWIDATEYGKSDPKRFNKWFIEAYKEVLNPNNPEKAPLTLMFNAFVGALDTVKAIEEGEEQ